MEQLNWLQMDSQVDVKSSSAEIVIGEQRSPRPSLKRAREDSDTESDIETRDTKRHKIVFIDSDDSDDSESTITVCSVDDLSDLYELDYDSDESTQVRDLGYESESNIESRNKQLPTPTSTEPVNIFQK